MAEDNSLVNNLSDAKLAITAEPNSSHIPEKVLSAGGHAQDTLKILDLNNKAQGYGKRRSLDEEAEAYFQRASG